MSRNSQLDSFRALAITVVMLHHYLDEPFLLSGFGVALFFVLSGYFATKALLKLRGEMDRGASFREVLLQFHMTRGLRLVPVYYLLLTLTALFGVEYSREWLFAHATFTANFELLRTGEWPGCFSQFWSLSVLEQFLLGWSLLVFLCPRRWLIPVALGIVAAAPLYRIFCLKAELDPLWWTVFPVASFDQLGCGALLALWKSGDSTRLAPRLGWAGAVSGTAFAVLLAFRARGESAPGAAIYLPLVASVFFAWLVERASRGFGGIVGRTLQIPLLVQIGQMTYSIYLIHTFTGYLLPNTHWAHSLMAGDWRVAVLIPLTLGVAWFSWRYLEMPLASLRRRAQEWTRTRSGPVAEQTSVPLRALT